MKLLAIDPAAENPVSDTGWALLYYDKNTPATLLDSGVVRGGFAGFCGWVLPESDVTVCEHYVVFNRAGDPTPLMAEGVVRYLRPDVVLQPSSGYKTAVSDAVLKNLGLWSTKGHHADERSALRHGLWYLKRIRHMPTLKAGWIMPFE